MGITPGQRWSENTPWLTGKQLSLHNSFRVKRVFDLVTVAHGISEHRGMVFGVRISVRVWEVTLVNSIVIWGRSDV